MEARRVWRTYFIHIAQRRGKERKIGRLELTAYGFIVELLVPLLLSLCTLRVTRGRRLESGS